MAFRKEYKAKGFDTSTTIGGYLSVGTHTVKIITPIEDMQTTIRLTLSNNFGDIIVDRIFINSKESKGYSKKLMDLLTAVPLEIMKDVVDSDNFRKLEGQELVIKVVKSEGNFIERVSNGFMIKGPEEISKTFQTYNQTRTALDNLGNKAYNRVESYFKTEKINNKGVW